MVSEPAVRGAGLLAASGRRQIWAAGRTLHYTRVTRESSARAAETVGGLAATIPSVVVEVLVEEGQRVDRGEKLLLLESMKMILPIQAPHEGIVESIDCAEGDSVAPGRPLLRLVDVETET